jgi:hypothetical protein
MRMLILCLDHIVFSVDGTFKKDDIYNVLLYPSPNLMVRTYVETQPVANVNSVNKKEMTMDLCTMSKTCS